MDMTATALLADRLDAVLPQTQCRRCGYDSCRLYAEAMADGDRINRCPPGGDDVIALLAGIAARLRVPLDPAHGEHRPLTVARIDEARCIGCTLCIQACPVDAIVGAAKRMHTVIAALCSGCDLCVPPCPVDCIEIAPAARDWSADDAVAARLRFDARERRLAAAADAAGPGQPDSTPTLTPTRAPDPESAFRREAVAAATARARARRSAAAPKDPAA